MFPMFIPFMLQAMLQGSPAPSAPPASTWKEAPSALAAMAPGHPGYGLILETEEGRFLLTNLGANLRTRQWQLKSYRILGPAGLGPYRYGFELRYHAKDVPAKKEVADCNYDDFFYPVSAKAHGMFGLEPDSPAEEAGLSRRWYILGIDGRQFGWNPSAADYYLSTRPSVEIQANKCPLFFGAGTHRTFKLTGKLTPAPPNPEEGTLRADGGPAVGAALRDDNLWKALHASMKRASLGSSIEAVLPGGARVQVLTNPWFIPEGSDKPAPAQYEIWEMAPAERFVQVLGQPLEGRHLQIQGHWYRLQGVRLGPDGIRPESLHLAPWTPDIQAMLAGRRSGRIEAFGSAEDLEAFEALGNDALLTWKVRALPGELAAQDQAGAEDLVLRLEKGLLALDLEVKTLRGRLDEAARAETERRAQAELAVKEGKPAPAAVAPSIESGRLADLLEQRKAILMAVLGSAKQALAGLRR